MPLLQPPPPPDGEERQHLPSTSRPSLEHSTRLLDLSMAACCCVAQTWAWTSSTAAPRTTGSGAVQAALLSLQAAVLALFLLAGRRTWRRWRAWALTAMRLASVANLPLLHTEVRLRGFFFAGSRPGGHTEPLRALAPLCCVQAGLGQMLDHPATPGVLGAVVDWLRLLAGEQLSSFLSLFSVSSLPFFLSPKPPTSSSFTILLAGLLPSLFAGAACRLSPAATLAQQAAVVGLSTALTGVQATCRTPLLADPLSIRRMSALHRLLDGADLLSPLVPAAAGPWTHGGTGSAGSSDAAHAATCAALVYLHLLAAFLLPVALASRAAPLPPMDPMPRPRRQPASSGGPPWSAVLRDGRSSRVGLLAAAWLLLSNAWLVCKALAARLRA